MKVVVRQLYILHHVHVMPTSMHEMFNVAAVTQVEKVTYVVCPNDVCNQLYKPIDAGRVLTCTNVIFGKVCKSELGYYRSLAFFKMKWTPHKVFHFISPSAWLRHFFKSNLFCNLLQGFKPIPISPNRKINHYRLFHLRVMLYCLH